MNAANQQMLHIYSAFSGEAVADLDIAEFDGKPTKVLKEHLSCFIGTPRFRLKLFLEDKSEIQGETLFFDPSECAPGGSSV